MPDLCADLQVRHTANRARSLANSGSELSSICIRSGHRLRTATSRSKTCCSPALRSTSCAISAAALLGAQKRLVQCTTCAVMLSSQAYLTAEERAVEEERIAKYSTSMYRCAQSELSKLFSKRELHCRAPEMVDLFKKQVVSEKVDIWVRLRSAAVCFSLRASAGTRLHSVLHGVLCSPVPRWRQAANPQWFLPVHLHCCLISLSRRLVHNS